MTKTEIASSLPHDCVSMRQCLLAGECPLLYISKYREYGLKILDGGSSYIVINFCPWCGTKLPTSMRDRWFTKLDRLGLEPDSPNLPEAFNTDAWWMLDQNMNDDK